MKTFEGNSAWLIISVTSSINEFMQWVMHKNGSRMKMKGEEVAELGFTSDEVDFASSNRPKGGCEEGRGGEPLNSFTSAYQLLKHVPAK